MEDDAAITTCPRSRPLLRTEAVLSRILLGAGLEARTRNCGGRRGNYDVPSLAPLLRTEAVLSRLLLADGAARRGARSFACIGDTSDNLLAACELFRNGALYNSAHSCV